MCTRLPLPWDWTRSWASSARRARSGCSLEICARQCPCTWMHSLTAWRWFSVPPQALPPHYCLSLSFWVAGPGGLTRCFWPNSCTRLRLDCLAAQAWQGCEEGHPCCPQRVQGLAHLAPDWDCLATVCRRWRWQCSGSAPRQQRLQWAEDSGS